MDAVSRRKAGRPRAFDREAALATALDLFWKQGYEGTSTAQLIEALGITSSSLYAAFGSKDALYFETLKLYQQQHAEYFRQALAEQTSGFAAMHAVLKGAARQFTGAGHVPGCMVATANVQCASDHLLIAETLSQMRRDALQALQQRLDQAIVEGELPVGTNTLALATFYSLVIQGMAVQAHDGASQEVLLQSAELAMQSWPVSPPPPANT
ncbi:TetR/AcrR family transcriptional regulator [Parachitinimonas caeni]|uniref:TetR/AcrR family transcriptional regulator n=1 Tax=Parachitinimonas caeni TaxID=3031301 RepID=A0ABT7DWY5_9NEIS|nr:TetR/AcrR family transcriptional regulator [Parachitinimonas caeni]MDK2124581.1 TetR/AcrR family transcriptional regulator [Parachitinimonas caeni]